MQRVILVDCVHCTVLLHPYNTWQYAKCHTFAATGPRVSSGCEISQALSFLLSLLSASPSRARKSPAATGGADGAAAPVASSFAGLSEGIPLPDVAPSVSVSLRVVTIRALAEEACFELLPWLLAAAGSDVADGFARAR